MQETPLYALMWLFFLYSFLGWAAESAAAALRKGRLVNRGILSGPFSPIYGFAAVVITATLRDLEGAPGFLFLGAAILAGFIEWLTGRLLERVTHRRWWDYSKTRFHIDGYVCLQSAAAWGFLGVLGLKLLNPLLMQLGGLIPRPVLQIILWALTSFAALDALWSYAALRESAGVGEKGLVAYKRRRVARAYPTAATKLEREPGAAVFAAGCGFYKVFLIFIIGAFLGDATETIFCYLTAGEWMSRSSVVWGPFSLVWGLGLAIGTLVLYSYRNRTSWTLFLFGAVLGGAFEYLCSVFTEVAFGKVFWDYSHQPFNLGGRTSLLFCFFWGIAVVVWFKALYPRLSGWIERLPMRLGKALTWCLAAFMLANVGVSVLALARAQSREAEKPAGSAWEELMDRYYDDETLQRIYPNAIEIETAD